MDQKCPKCDGADVELLSFRFDPVPPFEPDPADSSLLRRVTRGGLGKRNINELKIVRSREVRRIK